MEKSGNTEDRGGSGGKQVDLISSKIKNVSSSFLRAEEGIYDELNGDRAW